MSRIRSRKYALRYARENNLKVIKGNPHTILLDLDDDASELHYRKTLPKVQEHLEIFQDGEWRSEHGGLHVRLRTARKLSVRSRLLIQACLGSDRLKEFLSLTRVWKNQPDPVMLFKPRKRSSIDQRRAPEYSGNEMEYSDRWAANAITDDDVPF